MKLATRFSAPVCLAVCLMAAVASAQTPSEPPSTAIISPKSETKADAAIEPRKPAISEDSDDVSIAVDPASLLPDLPPVPKENATLVGGTIEKIDLVRDRVVVRIFGGGREVILFDPRTQVYRGKQAVTVADLREGERIYLDTILDNRTVFARAIRLRDARASGASQGVVLNYRADRGELSFRDALSPNPVQVRVSPSTKVTQGDRPVALSTLIPGSLISVKFSSEGGGHNTAGEIAILAQPGMHYTFSGQVVHIDLRSGLLVLNSSTDHKTYEVYLSPSLTPDDNLQPGATATVITDFDGAKYVARSVTINSR